MKGMASSVPILLILLTLLSGPTFMGIDWPLYASADASGPPVITDLSQTNATTGGTFQVQANVTAYAPLQFVGAWTWTDDNETLNWTEMVHLSADLYSITVNVSLNASFFNYRIWALDTTGVDNSTNTSIMNISVKDDRSPVVAEFSTNGTLDPATGEPVEFNATVWDNIRLANIGLNMSCDSWANSTRTNMSNGTVQGRYNLTIYVPETCTHLWARVEAQDPSGNKMTSTVKDAVVRDVISPTLADMTTGTPEDGKRFSIRASASDNIAIASVNAMVSFNGVPPWTVLGLEHNLTTGFWDGSVQVQVNASTMNLSLNATDTTGNWAMVQSGPRTVLDLIKPIINLTIPADLAMNSTIRIEANVSDNRGISGVWAEYKVDGGALLVQNLVRSPASGRFIADLHVDNISTFDIAVAAVDSVGNENRTPLIRYPVVDTSLPDIQIENDPAPTTGNAMVVHFRASDNIAVEWTGVVFWFDDGPMTNATLLGVSNGRFSYDIQVPANSKMMNLLVTAKDRQGNVANELKSIAVMDDDPPTFLDDAMALDVTTGDLVRLGTLLDFVTDNIGVDGMDVEYWVGALHGSLKITDRTSGAIMVPSNATNLRFRITAWDEVNNTANSRLHNIDVIDNDAPEMDLIMQPGTKAVPNRDMEISVVVRDNFDVGSVTLTAQGTTVPLIEDTEIPDVWSVTIHVEPVNLSGSFHFQVQSTDLAGNVNSSWDVSILFDLSVGPALTDYDLIWTDPAIFDVMANVSDNVGIAHVYIEGTGKDVDNLPRTELTRMGDVRADGSMAMYLRVTGFKGEGMVSFKITVQDTEGNDVWVTFSENAPEAAKSDNGSNNSMITAMLAVIIVTALLYVALIIYKVNLQKTEGRLVELEEGRHIHLMPKPQSTGKKTQVPGPGAKEKARPEKGKGKQEKPSEGKNKDKTKGKNGKKKR